MKYFVINTTIYDGEYEYLSQSPVMAKTEEQALKLAEDDAKDWTENDYREYDVSTKAEITEDEYKIISKHIY